MALWRRPLEKGPGMTTGAARGEPRGTTFVRVGGDGITVGQRQELMRDLAPQAPVRLRISADLRFNVLIATCKFTPGTRTPVRPARRWCCASTAGPDRRRQPAVVRTRRTSSRLIAHPVRAE